MSAVTVQEIVEALLEAKSWVMDEDDFATMVNDIVSRIEAHGIAPPDGWRPIETAPDDGRFALVFRPLARNSSEETVAVKRLIGGNNFCWGFTVPDGETATNPTDGACHVTHWMPLPAAPEVSK